MLKTHPFRDGIFKGLCKKPSRNEEKKHLNDKLYEFLKVIFVVGYLSIKMAIYIKNACFAWAHQQHAS
jgi:hypothetical protein